MQINKLKIVERNRDINIKFSLDTQIDILGHQENINNFVDEQTDLVINEPLDNDISIIKKNDSKSILFKYGLNDEYYSTLENVGFTLKMIKTKELPVVKSFYMFEVFNNFNISNREKLSITYLPLVNLTDYGLSTQYNSLNQYEFTDLYIPNYLINTLEFINDEVTLYGRFTFYNAILKKFHLFINENNKLLFTDKREMIEIIYNRNNNTYSFKDPNIVMYENTNLEYSQNMNDTILNRDNVKPIYPNGKTFSNGNYS